MHSKSAKRSSPACPAASRFAPRAAAGRRRHRWTDPAGRTGSTSGRRMGPADLIIGIAAPEGTGDAHMKLLAGFQALVRKDFLASLRAAKTPAEAAALISAIVQPDEPKPAAAPAPVPAASTAPAPAGEPAKPVILAITSCSTGIAHTYMAAEALEEAAKEKGIELHVETRAWVGSSPHPR